MQLPMQTPPKMLTVVTLLASLQVVNPGFAQSAGLLLGVGTNEWGELGYFASRIATGVIDAAAGDNHSLFVLENGDLYASGEANWGQLGDGTPTGAFVVRHSPILVASDVKAVAAGTAHSLFIKNDDTLWAMGNNSYGQLGDGSGVSKSTPVQIATDVVAAKASIYQSAFLKKDGSLWWMGVRADWVSFEASPQLLASDVVEFAVGAACVFFLTSNGDLWGIGDNGQGNLISNGPYEIESPVLVAQDVRSIADGLNTTFFIKNDNSLWQMGYVIAGVNEDDSGVLISSNNPPVKIADGVLAVDSSWYNSLFIKEDKSLWGTGWHEFGQLGRASSDRIAHVVPAPVGATNVSQVSVGLGHSLYITEDHTLWGIGSNYYGQRGQLHPEPLQTASGVTEIATGENFSLYLKSDGVLWGSGGNESGQLGLGSNRFAFGQPILSDVLTMAAGAFHSLVIKSDHSLWAMGDNEFGQLGDGSSQSQSAPILIADDVHFVAAGKTHSFYIKGDGSMWGMGGNDNGQIGDGTTTNRSTPVWVADDVAFVSAGTSHSLFLKNDGSLWGMGENWVGELGDGTELQRLTPIHVADDVVSASAGDNHSVFVKQDGTLWAMGYNFDGELGDGTRLHRSSPVQVADQVVHAVAGNGTSLFVKTDGSLWLMGKNRFVKLSEDGDPKEELRPVRVVARDVTKVSTGSIHHLYIVTARFADWTDPEADGWIDTGSFLGWIYYYQQGDRGWINIPDMGNKVVYADFSYPEGAWIYFPSFTDNEYFHGTLGEQCGFAGYLDPECDGWIDTGSQLLGWLFYPDQGSTGWANAASNNKWFYIGDSTPTGAWMFLPL